MSPAEWFVDMMVGLKAFKWRCQSLKRKISNPKRHHQNQRRRTAKATSWNIDFDDERSCASDQGYYNSTNSPCLSPAFQYHQRRRQTSY